MIQVHDFHKAYDGKIAVAGLSFGVEPGQILGMVGPNGAGKTTTLRAICGVIPPSHGRIAIDGYDVRENPVEAKLRIAYVPDDPKAFDVLTVWEHMRYTASAYGVKDYTAKANALLERFELTEHRDKMGGELSRGMRQKMALCCAYLHDPKVILLDEPMTGIDPLGIRTTKQSIREEAAKGAAIVLSSHLLDIVEDLCTHLLILHEGECLFLGALDEARERFRTSEGETSLEEAFIKATSAKGSPPPLPQESVDEHRG
ncbi:MAG: ABC transporter ATP-binding protein [Candidatus Hydrogenedentes bacterium]|nr:ABC transporter ATP-binding protein [Candidatus Hydrogenedentota bacterium]